jgi:hypothetical protein
MLPILGRAKDKLESHMPIIEIAGNNGNHNAWDLAVNELRKHGTGRTIWEYLQNDDRDFDVLVTPPAFHNGQMLIEEDKGDVTGLAKNLYQQTFNRQVIIRPVLIFNPTFSFDVVADIKGLNINVDGSRVNRDTLSAKIDDILWKKPPFSAIVRRGTLTTYPPHVVLAHELGHMKQYFETSDSAISRAADWIKRIVDINALEADNLARHEHPYCKELGIPYRVNYKDIPGYQLAQLLTDPVPEPKPYHRYSLTAAAGAKDESELVNLANRHPTHGFFTPGFSPLNT